MNPPVNRKSAGQIFRGVDLDGVDRNILIDITGALVTASGGGDPRDFNNGMVAASSPGAIPEGATEWSITVITGTATIGSAAAIPAGFTASGSGPVKTGGIAFTTDPGSTAYFQYLS